MDTLDWGARNTSAAKGVTRLSCPSWEGGQRPPCLQRAANLPRDRALAPHTATPHLLGEAFVTSEQATFQLHFACP
jgi:hypothetical protein